MPICIIALKQTANPILEDEIHRAVQLGRESLKVLLAGLDIPEFDQEIRIVKGEEDKITFAFTVGGEEYPEHHPGKIFDPNMASIHEVGNQIKQLVESQSQNKVIPPISIETYRESAFMMVDPNLVDTKESDTKPPSILETDGLLQDINADVRLTVSPKQYSELQSASRQGKEISPTEESEIFTQITQNLARITETNIGKENEKPSYEIALDADAPAAVEVRIKNDTLLSKDGLFRLALELNGEMVSRNLTGEGSSIWVTQEVGKAIYTI